MAKKEEPKHIELEKVEHALTTSELFIEKHQKQILIGVAAVVLIVLAVLSFRNFYMEPREINAENEMYKAQALFATDSFRVALEGNGNQIMGFKEIISEFGMTPSANLAAAYAGICSYKLGKFEEAIKFLSQYDGNDTYIKTTIAGLTGDSYVELGETDKAVSYFNKAADMNNTVLSAVYLKKAGLVYESLNQPEKAEKKYTAIKEKYPKSSEAADIDKYLARVQK
jgi:tetratricopeptide (TPR) repeat protein